MTARLLIVRPNAAPVALTATELASDLRRAAAALFIHAPHMRASGYPEQAEAEHSAATKLMSEALRLVVADAEDQRQDVA